MHCAVESLEGQLTLAEILNFCSGCDGRISSQVQRLCHQSLGLAVSPTLSLYLYKYCLAILGQQTTMIHYGSWHNIDYPQTLSHTAKCVHFTAFQNTSLPNPSISCSVKNTTLWKQQCKTNHQLFGATCKRTWVDNLSTQNTKQMVITAYTDITTAIFQLSELVVMSIPCHLDSVFDNIIK